MKSGLLFLVLLSILVGPLLLQRTLGSLSACWALALEQLVIPRGQMFPALCQGQSWFFGRLCGFYLCAPLTLSLHSNLHLLNYNHQRKMPDYYTLGNVRIPDQESQIVFNSFS